MNDVLEMLELLEDCIIEARTYSFVERSRMFDTIKQALEDKDKRIKELEKYINYALSVGSVQSSKVPNLQFKLNAIRDIVENIDDNKLYKLVQIENAFYKIKEVLNEH